jgi:hypothetical protein
MAGKAENDKGIPVGRRLWQWWKNPHVGPAEFRFLQGDRTVTSSLLAARCLMECRRIWVGWLGLVAGMVCVTSGTPQAGAGGDEGPGVRQAVFRGDPDAAVTLRTGLFRHRSTESQSAAAELPLDQLSADIRGNVQLVATKPTLYAHAPAELFTCCPSIYHWLLDHPDQAVQLWRRLGAKCMDIQDRGKGVFGWSDGQGSDVRWWLVHRTAQMRIWYAEGSARATGILPLVPVRAVMVLRHTDGKNGAGRTLVRHQIDLFLQTDSKTAALVTRLMGPSAPRMAEQSAGQIGMFFSALAWYLDQHPDRAQTVLEGVLPADASEWQEVRQRARVPRSTGTMPPGPVP